MNQFLLLAYFLLSAVISSQTKPGFKSKVITCTCLLFITAVVYIDASLA